MKFKQLLSGKFVIPDEFKKMDVSNIFVNDISFDLGLSDLKGSQLETYALLAGSVGLFLILAIMYYSQKINWSK